MTTAELKRQLNIEVTYTDDDVLLQLYLDVAQEAVINDLNYGTESTSGITGTNMPVSLKQAILLLAAHLYVTRTPVAFGQGYKIPLTFEYLINPYKQFTVN